MKWKVSFYNEKVMKDLLKWPVGIKAKFTHIVNLLEQYGPIEVGMPFIKSMGEGLYEIRSKGKEGIARAFFCMIVNKEIVILHGFIKKDQKTPNKELKIAKKRLREVVDGK